MDDIERITPRAREYLELIPEEQWRGTAWLDNPYLPPRFGIYTSNMSESVNNMFEKARDKSWLFSLDTILTTMMKRITSLRTKHKGKVGVVDHVKGVLLGRWNEVAAYEVYQLKEDGVEFTIVRKKTTKSAPTTQYTINEQQRTCECGQWQEFGYPCVDAMAFLRLFRRLSFHDVLSGYVDKVHTYDAEKAMLEDNIIPVCIAHIKRDLTTLPPNPLNKRSSGRPKKKRLRKRSRWSHTPNSSNVRCSRCKQRGHNIRTCETRHLLTHFKEGSSPDSDDGSNHLDLS